MKILAFRVELNQSANFHDLMVEFCKIAIKDRVRQTSSGEVSLKSATPSQGNCWHLDFTKFRHIGPSKAPKDRPNVDFDLLPDEFFGEETAAIFIPTTQTLVMQFNHHGPRSASIEQYLQSIAHDLQGKMAVPVTKLVLLPVIQRDALLRMEKMLAVRKLEFTVYMPGALQAPQTSRKSVGSVLNQPILSHPEQMTIRLSAGRSKSFDKAEVKSAVTELIGMGSDVTYLKVHGTEDENAPSKPLDLLGAQLSADRKLVSPSRKRHGLQERLSALRSAYDEWERNGQV